MQELIDYMHNHRMDMREEYGLIFVTLRDVEIMLEKEKQFAFDCFEAGMDYSSGSNTNFEQFYSRYAEQHTK